MSNLRSIAGGHEHTGVGKAPRQSVAHRFQGKAFLIPGFVTVIGLLCGFTAIICALNNDLERAALYIGFAFIIDGLDGRVARSLNAVSAFGKEFDSLSDVIAFGVAPAVITYQWAFHLLADRLGITIAFLYVACGAIRLARFNISEPRKHFQGLPIPAAAVVIASLIYFSPTPVITTGMSALVGVLVVTLAGLMVSPYTFLSIKHLKLSIANPRLLLAAISLFVAIASYHLPLFMLLGCLVYAFSGPCLHYFGSKPK